MVDKLDRLPKSIRLINAVSCLAAILLIILTPGSNGFETFTFRSYPYSIQIAVVLTICSSVAFYGHTLLRSNEQDFRPFYFTLVTYFMFIALPVLKSYSLYGRNNADLLQHMGMAKYIQSTGTIVFNDWYPYLHILFAELMEIGVPNAAIAVVSAVTFYFLFILSTALYLREVTGEISSAYFIIIIPLIFRKFTITNHPFMISFIISIVALWWDTNTYSLRSEVITAILIVAAIIAHPVSGAVCLILLTTQRYLISGKSYLTIIICSIIYASWQLNFDKWEGVIYYIFILSGKVSPFSQKASSASAVDSQVNGLYTYYIIIYKLIENYGPTLIIMGLGGVCIILFTFKFSFNKIRIYLSSFYVGGVTYALAFGLNNFIASNPVRISRYAIFAAICLSAILLRIMADNQEWRKILVIILAILIILPGIAVYNVYLPNKHVTEGEVSGNVWFIDNRQTSQVIISGQPTYKFTYYLTGTDPRTHLDGDQSPPIYYSRGKKTMKFSEVNDTDIPRGSYIIKPEASGIAHRKLNNDKYIGEKVIRKSEKDISRIYHGGNMSVYQYT